MNPDEFWENTESDEFFHLFHSNINININNVYGWSCEDSKETFIVLELMEGSLNNLLWGENKKSLNDNEKIKILLDIAHGVSYLHENRMLHRDLKSLNVLYKFDNNYFAKLCDLGLTIKKSQSDKSMNILNISAYRVIGTMLWLPHECLQKGKKNFSKYSDVYSYGIVMYEVIDQNKPFSNNSETIGIDMDDVDYAAPDLCEILKKGITPEFSKNLTNKEKKLKEIMLKCLEVDPQKRILFDKIIELLEKILISEN
jgi:serine/threonine protein kinase